MLLPAPKWWLLCDLPRQLGSSLRSACPLSCPTEQPEQLLKPRGCGWADVCPSWAGLCSHVAFKPPKTGMHIPESPGMGNSMHPEVLPVFFHCLLQD